MFVFARAALAVGSTALVVTFGTPAASANSVHRYETSWNVPAGTRPTPQAVDALGNVYLYNEGNQTVGRYDHDGNPVNFSALGTNVIDGEGGFNCPTTPTDCDRVPLGDFYQSGFTPTIGVDTTNGPAAGYIYVENQAENAAATEVFAPSGEFVGEINTNSDAPLHIEHRPGSINLDQLGNIYLMDRRGSAGLMDKYVPVDGNPAHDVFGGQIRSMVPIVGNSNEYSISAQEGAGGAPLSYGMMFGGLQPEYPFGPIYAYEPEQFHVVNLDNALRYQSAFVPERLFGIGVDEETGSTWRNLTLDAATGHVYLQNGRRVQEWDGKGNPVGSVFGLPYGANSQAIAIDDSNLATRGTVYMKGSQNANNSIAVLSPRLPTPDITYGTPNVGHETAHLVGQVELAGGPEVTECMLEWGTTTGQVQASPELTLAIFERTPLPCSQVTPYSSDEEVTVDMSNLPTEQSIHYRFVAANENGVSRGKTMQIQPHAVLDVSTDPATNVTRSAATLNASMDLDGLDTTYYFEYGLDTHYKIKTAEVAAGSESGVKPVAGVNINKLQPGTRYHYRVVAINALGVTYGPDRLFVAGSSPTISSVRARNVTETSADIYANVNPVGRNAKYHFEFGTSVGYGDSTPELELGPETTNQLVSAHLEGLQRGATYHFRLVASNAFGATIGEDTTFNYAPVVCPNSHVRQQTGANYLPDCRAYELVSPEDAAGTYIVPSDTVFDWGRRYGGGEQLSFKDFPQNTGLATAPSRFNFFGALAGLPGHNTPNITSDSYISTRTNEGWVSTYAGPEASEVFADARIQCSRSLDRCLSRPAISGLADEDAEESNAPMLYDVGGEYLGRLPTNVGAVKDGLRFKGEGRASPNFSHFVFVSRDIRFAPGGASEAPGTVYDNNLATDTVQIVSKLQNGEPIPQDPSSASNPEDYFDVPYVSGDGGRILIGARTQPRCINAFPSGCPHPLDPNPPMVLYMRTGGGVTYSVSRGKPVHLDDVARNGDYVYFSSSDSFSPADQDTSEDLYRWDEATETIALLSAGGEGAGNSDSCSVSWTDGCGVVPLRSCHAVWNVDTCEARSWGFPTERPDIDTGTASSSGATLFYSPEQLDPENPGVANQRNLYLERNGQVQYVTTFEPGSEANRYYITPDGAHVAFSTTSSLSGYDNVAAPLRTCQMSNANERGSVGATCREIYSYDSETGALRCVSCDPSGDRPVGDANASAGGPFMSDNGRVFFSTPDPLVPSDTDGLYSVYEYVDGRPQLISSGTSDEDYFPGLLNLLFGPFWDPAYAGVEAVSGDGRDVYFSTFDSLVPQDKNGRFLKIYDARTNGGIPTEIPPLPCAAADECHGPTYGGAAEVEVGSGGELGDGGNFHSVRTRSRHRRHRRRRHRAASRRSRAHAHRSNTVKVGGPHG